jgi:hypothetical protein
MRLALVPLLLVLQPNGPGGHPAAVAACPLGSEANLAAAPPAKLPDEWGAAAPAGWGPDSATDTLEILNGLKIPSGGSVSHWEVFTSGAGKVAAGAAFQ